MDELLWGVPLKEVALQRAFKKWAEFKFVLIFKPCFISECLKAIWFNLKVSVYSNVNLHFCDQLTVEFTVNYSPICKAKIRGDRFVAKPSQLSPEIIREIVKIAAFYSGAQSHVNDSVSFMKN